MQYKGITILGHTEVTFCHQVTFFTVIFATLHKRDTRRSVNKTADQQHKQSIEQRTCLFQAFNWFLLHHLLNSNIHSLLLYSALLYTVGTLHYVSI